MRSNLLVSLSSPLPLSEKSISSSSSHCARGGGERGVTGRPAAPCGPGLRPAARLAASPCLGTRPPPGCTPPAAGSGRLRRVGQSDLEGIPARPARTRAAVARGAPAGSPIASPCIASAAALGCAMCAGVLLAAAPVNADARAERRWNPSASVNCDNCVAWCSRQRIRGIRRLTLGEAWFKSGLLPRPRGGQRGGQRGGGQSLCS
jgi:hypothetical protein